MIEYQILLDTMKIDLSKCFLFLLLLAKETILVAACIDVKDNAGGVRGFQISRCATCQHFHEASHQVNHTLGYKMS